MIYSWCYWLVCSHVARFMLCVFIVKAHMGHGWGQKGQIREENLKTVHWDVQCKLILRNGLVKYDKHLTFLYKKAGMKETHVATLASYELLCRDSVWICSLPCMRLMELRLKGVASTLHCLSFLCTMANTVWSHAGCLQTFLCSFTACSFHPVLSVTAVVAYSWCLGTFN